MSLAAALDLGLMRVCKAMYMSSTMVSCVVPARGQGIMTLLVSNNGVDGGEGVKYEYGAEWNGVRLKPSMGPVSGGSPVTVSGALMPNGSGPVTCLFGSERRGWCCICEWDACLHITFCE